MTNTYLAHEFPPAVHTEVSAALCSFDPNTTSEGVRLHVKSGCNAAQVLNQTKQNRFSRLSILYARLYTEIKMKTFLSAV